jgi:signal recognition particle receptor subunit beta
VDYFEHRRLPFVRAVNCFDRAKRYRPEAIRTALKLKSDVPVLLCDARQCPSSRGGWSRWWNMQAD